MISCRSLRCQFQGQRNDVSAGCPQTLFKQRMPPAFNLQPLCVQKSARRSRTRAQTAPAPAGCPPAPARARPHQALRVAAHLPRERHKDAVNLRLLFFDQPHQLVVLLDGLKRLHVHRLPRRTRAMNHARDAPLELRAHRNHKALAANGDDIVLRCAIARELAQRRAQAFFNQPLLALLLAPNAVQLRRCIVGQRPVRLNLALDRLGQRPQTRASAPTKAPKAPAACPPAAPAARAATPATRPHRSPAAQPPAIPRLPAPRLQSALWPPVAWDRTVRPAQSKPAPRAAAAPRPQAGAGARSTLHRSKVAARESPSRPTGDAANPATSASSGSHSSAARSACLHRRRNGIEQRHDPVTIVW